MPLFTGCMPDYFKGNLSWTGLCVLKSKRSSALSVVYGSNLNPACCKEEIPLAACGFHLKSIKYFYMYYKMCSGLANCELKLWLCDTRCGANGIFLCLCLKCVVSLFCFFVNLKGNVLGKSSTVSSVCSKKERKKYIRAVCFMEALKPFIGLFDNGSIISFALVRGKDSESFLCNEFLCRCGVVIT